MADWLDDTASKQVAEKYLTADQLVAQRIDDIQSGKIRPMPMPWHALTRDVRALVSGTVNVLCGDPGSAKSFMTIELFAHLHRAGESVALYELECTRQWHLMRVLAQESSTPQVIDMEWVRGHGDYAKMIVDRHRAFVESFGRCLHASPDESITADDLLRWVDKQCQAGVKVIGIDPITALMPSEKPWIDDHHTITQLRRIIGKYDATAWLVTHPKKGRKAEIGLDVLAGGAAFARFTDTVLWLERLDGLEEHEIHGVRGRIKADRVLHICKCRDGVAGGKQLSMQLNHTNLRFDAFGWIERRHRIDAIENEVEDLGL
jgi:hypothetical protein